MARFESPNGRQSARIRRSASRLSRGCLYTSSPVIGEGRRDGTGGGTETVGGREKEIEDRSERGARWWKEGGREGDSAAERQRERKGGEGGKVEKGTHVYR